MFEGLHNVLKRKTDNAPKLADRKGSQLILKPDKLLATEKRREHLDKFPKLLSLSVENYQSLCQSVLNSFAEFVQELPETQHSYYAHKGGLLDHALSRTAIALSLVRNYFLPSGSGEAPLTQPQTLWAYAVFTAALLHDIGKTVVDLEVKLYDRQLTALQTWSPFVGPMTATAAYYKYDFTHHAPDNFRKQVTLLLARQIMPAAGFNWIASNPDVFAVWLAMLSDDKSMGGTLGPILLRADALSIGQYFETLRLQRAYGVGTDRSNRFGFNQPSTDQPSEATAFAFLQWIQKSLESGDLKLGESPMNFSDDGLIITKELMQKYSQETGGTSDSNWMAVQDSIIKFIESDDPSGKADKQTYLHVKDNIKIEGYKLSKVDLVIPGTMTADVLRNSSILQSSFVKMPTAVVSLNTTQYIATNGQMVTQAPVVEQTQQPSPTKTR